jgi:hypothetical protein
MFLLSSLLHVTVGSGIPVALHFSRTEPFSGAIPASGDSSLRISGGTLTSKVPIWKRKRHCIEICSDKFASKVMMWKETRYDIEDSEIVKYQCSRPGPQWAVAPLKKKLVGDYNGRKDNVDVYEENAEGNVWC